jgi:putative redox protein
MRVNVSYGERFQFKATARGHEILGDQPIENGGDNAGMTPPEWFLASIGSCVGFYAVKYLQARNLNAGGLNIDVSAQKTTDTPSHIDDISIHLSLPISLENRHQKGLEAAVKSCLIHNTLTHSPKIVTQITSASLVS